MPDPMDKVSEIRLQDIYPRLADLTRQLAAELRAEGTYIRVVQGLRTSAVQDALYAQGRTEPGKIVTNARGGYSWHCMGLAIDCAPMLPDGSVDWNAGHPAWKRMETLGVALGLTSGATWIRIVDAPHFQLTGPWPAAAPTDVVRELLRQGGLAMVWRQLDAHLEAANPPVVPPSSI
jgi:D-alanyl-D-alanine carboxypeptidase